jgi:hypothetical protein
MAARVHEPLKVIAFNANDIWRRRYELSNHLQDIHIEMSLCSQRHNSKSMRVSSFKIIMFIGLIASHEEKASSITT